MGTSEVSVRSLQRAVPEFENMSRFQAALHLDLQAPDYPLARQRLLAAIGISPLEIPVSYSPGWSVLAVTHSPYTRRRKQPILFIEKELCELSYELFYLPSGIIEIRCTPGQITHIRFHAAEGTWTVDEDEKHRVFKTFGQAKDCAREVGGDPDLGPAER